MQTIDLSGKWELCMEPAREGSVCTEAFGRGLTIPTEYPYEITLPGSISYAKCGTEKEERNTGYLTDPYSFDGFCWYRKKLSLPDFDGSKEKHVLLRLERTRISHVFVDGKYVGTRNSLVSAHEYDLSGLIHTATPVLTILISNVGYPAPGGHMTSPDTETNWNGILGEISLTISEAPLLTKASGRYHDDTKTLDLSLSNFGGNGSGTLQVSFERLSLKPEFFRQDSDCGVWDKKGLGSPAFPTDFAELKAYLDVTERVFPDVTVPVTFSDGAAAVSIPVPETAELWSEEHPVIYRLNCSLADCPEQFVSAFCGFHRFCAEGTHFTDNGKEVFLRGRHNGMLFPLSGFAPMNAEGWLRDFKIAKDWGMNHVRFHSCCPPEAAFLAADLLGMYLQTELPFWGSWYAETDAEYANAKDAQDYLTEEGFRMLRSFSGHASYVMMTMANEPWGSPDALNRLELGFQAEFPHILYSLGSNGFQFVPTVVEGDSFFSGVRFSRDRLFRGSYAQCDAPLGVIQTAKPTTDYDYDSNIRPDYCAGGNEVSSDGYIEIQYGTGVKRVKLTEAQQELVPEIPVVSHEIGQYCTYPDYREIPHYTGVLKPRNLEVFKERLEEAGMGSMASDFFTCSGKLAMDCYKRELETAMRSRQLAGYQILDLQDFSGQGTALVGPLNALMENKGLISAEKWRYFANDAVLLARFKDYVLPAGEPFAVRFETAYYRTEKLENAVLTAELSDRETGEIIDGKSLAVTEPVGRGRTELGSLVFCIPDVTEARKLLLRISLKETGCTAENRLVTDKTGVSGDTNNNGKDCDIRNEYELVVFPKNPAVSASVPVVKTPKEAVMYAKEHPESRSLLLLSPERNPNSVEGMYCTDFWCYPMFRSISESVGRKVPVGTLGLCISERDPALSGFASEHASTPQWFSIVEHSRSTVLDGTGITPIVRTIDNFERNHNLGLLYEVELEGTGSQILVMCADLSELSNDSIEAKNLLSALTGYLAGEKKETRSVISEETFLGLFRK